MSAIRKEVIYAALNRARALMDHNIHNDFHKQHEFRKQTVLADKSLTEDEKIYAIKKSDKDYDRDRVSCNNGTKRICENCNQECLATLYCEYCIRNYLKSEFPNWTSGNNDIDDLIQKCQLETIRPSAIVEWIPYNNLQNIKYLTKGGCSEIYTANWVDGSCDEWDSKKQQLERLGNQEVILKKLENVESANQRWFEEAKSHLNISNKSSNIVKSYGLTQDPSNGNYMLVMFKMAIDLRTYLQQNHNQLTLKEKIQIAVNIINAIKRIHKENAIHRDLHSGNILYSQNEQRFRVGDFGFCGPANKSSESIYGNLPYIAPEIISGKSTTKASDIYSIAILMWEISSGQPPFINHEHDYDLAMNIVNGIRPKIVSGTPLEYKNLMEQCWDPDPSKRPDICTLQDKMDEINLYYHQNESTQSEIETNNNSEINGSSTNYTSSRLFTSKVHQFENFPEPRNATEEEQEAFHSKSHDFYIPDNIDDFNKKNSMNSSMLSASKIIEGNSESLPKVFNKLQINSNNYSNTQNDYKREIMQQQTNVYTDDDDDDVHNNSNLHSAEQDELEILDVMMDTE